MSGTDVILIRLRKQRESEMAQAREAYRANNDNARPKCWRDKVRELLNAPKAMPVARAAEREQWEPLLSMDEALAADGEKLRALTGEDHGPYTDDGDLGQLWGCSSNG